MSKKKTGFAGRRALRSSPEYYAEDAVEHARIAADDYAEDPENARSAAQHAIERLREFLDATECDE